MLVFDQRVYVQLAEIDHVVSYLEENASNIRKLSLKKGFKHKIKKLLSYLLVMGFHAKLNELF